MENSLQETTTTTTTGTDNEQSSQNELNNDAELVVKDERKKRHSQNEQDEDNVNDDDNENSTPPTPTSPSPSASTTTTTTALSEEQQQMLTHSTTESMVNIESSGVESMSAGNSEISKSTVFITKSQYNGSENGGNDDEQAESLPPQTMITSQENASSTFSDSDTKEKVEEKEEDNAMKTQNDVNSDSMIMVQSSTTTSSSYTAGGGEETSSAAAAANENQNNVSITTDGNESSSEEESNHNKLIELTKTEIEASKQAEDVENLVKGYEIPNFEGSTGGVMTKSLENEISAKFEQIASNLQELEPSQPEASAKSSVSSSKRILENEKYQELLGNSSLLKKIVQYGEEGRRPLNGQMVTIEYEAFPNENPTKLIDHNENLNFILGDGDVIQGLDMVVSLMEKNEKCEMIAESRHAFGSLGKLPDIPPNATLLYKVHLKDFSDVTDLNVMSPIERLSLAEAKKVRGNYHYNRQDFPTAIFSYKKGLKYFNEENLRGDEEDQDLKKFLEVSQALLMNLALSYFKMNECREALNALEQVLAAQSKHIKALYIKGKILLQLGETEDAIKSLNLSLQLDPNNNDVRKELAKAQAKHKIQYENEKKMYKKMISSVGKSDKELAAEAKAKKSKKDSLDKDSSGFVTYIAAGLAIAVASIGVALFARYKNII